MTDLRRSAEARAAGHEVDQLSRPAVAALHALLGLVGSVLTTEAGELTLSQLRALVVIAESGPQRSVDLAAALSIDPSTVSRLCSRLEARGLISLRRSPRSKREVEIALTQKGGQLLDLVLVDGLRRIRGSEAAFARLELPPEPSARAASGGRAKGARARSSGR